MKPEIIICWIRRDLRLHDNPSLHFACSGKLPVLLLFIFDTEILEGLPKNDARVSFIYTALKEINRSLKGKLLVKYGSPVKVWKELLSQYNVKEVHAGRDYEPYGIARDAAIESFLGSIGTNFILHKDHVFFEPEETVKADGKPYLVYTPFMKNWRKLLNGNETPCFPSEKLLFPVQKRNNLAINGFELL